jgi:hypothetical protein
MTAGHVVVVKRGTLAGLAGVLVGPRGPGRWIVQLNQVQPGVLVVIGEPLLSILSPEQLP